MTTENINIVIREDGSRVVSRNIQQLGTDGEKTAKAMDTLARAMEVLAAAFAIDKLKEYADEWASITGIVEVATKTHQEAAAVLNQLFDAAQAVRTPIDQIAKLYGAAARAAHDLGASQQEAIQFTKEVGQALVVQHVSAEQASGALLQLGQLLGTGKVRAQEFNSVNENLSVVLTTVAKNIDGAGGSISKLKALVEKGTVGSKEFFQAFLKGSGDLQRDFDKSAFTIAQGFNLISNAFVKMIGEFNEATGVSNAFGQAAKFVADHMEDIKKGIVDIAKLLAIGTAAWASYAAAQATATAVTKVSEFIAYTNAVARGDIVILGSAEALRQKAVAAVAAAVADVRAAATAEAAALTQARASVSIAEAKTTEVIARQAVIASYREEAAAQLASANANVAQALRAVRASEAAGAQSFAIATLKDATVQLVAAEGTRGVAMEEMIALSRAQVASDTALTAALGEQAVAQAALTEATVVGAAAMAAAQLKVAKATETAAIATAAAAGTTGRLAQVWALLKAAIVPVIEVVGEFFALIAASPITALIVALVTVTGLLIGFGQNIDAGIDGTTTLGDVMTVLESRAVSAFKSIGDAASEAWKKLTADGKNALGTTTTAVASTTSEWAKSFSDFYATQYTGFAGFAVRFAKTLDAMLGLVSGFVNAVANVLGVLGNIFKEGFKAALNGVSESIEGMVNFVIDGLNVIRGALGQSLIEAFKIPKLDVDPKAFEDVGTQIGDAFGKGIEQGFDAQGGRLEKSVIDLIGDAQRVAIGRLNSGSNGGLLGQVDLGVKGKGSTTDNSKEVDKEREALRRLLDVLDPVTGALLEKAKAEATLEKAVSLGILSQDKAKNGLKSADDYLKALTLHYRDIIDPLGAYVRNLDEQNTLLGVETFSREAATEAFKEQQELLKKNIPLTATDTKLLQEKIQAHLDLARATAAGDAVIEASVGKRREFNDQLNAIHAKLADPASGFTQGDAAQAITNQFGDILAGTKTYTDANVALYANMYAQIDAYRQAGLISDETAEIARLNISIKANEQRQKAMSDFFGNIATLATSSNKRLAAIGKAAAIAQATIDGYAAIQKAYTSAPYPYNLPAVIAVTVATAANVAKIAGFESGGYTGDGGTSEPAGIVHGKEYVVNAAATVKNRSTLEAINSGASVGGNVTVNVINQSSNSKTETRERDTPTGKQLDIVITDAVARDIAKNGSVAQALQTQYGVNRGAGVTSR